MPLSIILYYVVEHWIGEAVKDLKAKKCANLA
jgi:hypothetical protein